MSHLLRLARLDARLDKRCLLGAATRMDVAGRPVREAPFHVLLEGRCRLQVGPAAVDMGPGDFVLIPSGSPHRVTTVGGADRRGTVEAPGDAFGTITSEDGADPVIDLFCGRYLFGPGAGAMLFASLPEPVHIRFGATAESNDVLRTLSALMRCQARREGEGSAVILASLCTVLLAMALSTARGPNTQSVLWTAVPDERIAAVVESVLDDPASDWSVERLAAAASMSRATLLRRFGAATGMSAGAFVARARLMAAAEALLSCDDTVARVARDVGYRSESAFSRAFRAEMGTTPARFRREQRG